MEIRIGDFRPKSATRPSAPVCITFYFLFSVALLGGCAAPGEPVERKAPTPTAITDLSATQRGDGVTLTFTLPHDSVEKRQLPQIPAVQVYRDFDVAAPSSLPSSGAPASSTLLLTIPPAMVDRYIEQGRVRFVDTLLAKDFALSGGREVVYLVRTFVSPKKLSAISNVATLTIFPAPDPIADLKAELAPSGVTLTWTPPQKTIAGTAPQIAFYRVYRSEAGSNAAPSPTPKVPLTRIADPASPPYTDTQAELGKTYIYSVRTVSSIPSEPLESLDSNFASITRNDIFPPSAPQNPVVVFVPAATGVPAHLELSWAINPETDIAGYNIYRSEDQHHPGTRINAELLQTPAFRDMNVVTGREYFYTVTAVDRSGNESPAGAPASGSIPVENQLKQDPSSE